MRRAFATSSRPREAARVRSKYPQSIEAVLRSALRSSGMDKQLDKYRFVLHWREIMGEEISRRTKPEALNGETLVVRVENSVWAQELSFQREVILARLNRFLGENGKVSDVLFYVGDIRSP